MPKESLWELVSRSVGEGGTIEKIVFFLLVAMSIVSWTIILLKLNDLYVARKSTGRFLSVFQSADRFGAVLAAEATLLGSPLLMVFKAALRTLEESAGRKGAAKPVLTSHDPREITLKPQATEDAVVLAMQNASKIEFARMQKGLGFLATVGSTSPFIGLFGTVWGIMSTFRDLGNAKSASLAVVAPGISSALIATAAGLAVAIPAVMAYNWLLSQFEILEDSSDRFIGNMNVLIRSSGCLSEGSSSATSSSQQVRTAQAANTVESRA